MTARRGIATLLALTLATGGLWTALGTFDAAMGQDAPIVIERAHDGMHAPDFSEPIFVLALGSDARDGLPDRTRYDSIHIVALDPASKRGTIVGIPRDSYVQSAGSAGQRKITDLGFLEDLDTFVRTVENLSGCSFDYRMVTAFDGFAGPFWRSSNPARNRKGGVINEIGGVTVKIPSGGLTDRDALHNLDPIKPGKQVLNGPQALAWSRSRKQVNIRPRGDFSRSEAQGALMKSVLAEMIRDYKQTPGTALRNIAAVKRHVKANIPTLEMLRLGLWGLQFKPKRITNMVVDGTTDTANGASIVRITARGRAQLTDVCADGLLDAS